MNSRRLTSSPSRAEITLLYRSVVHHSKFSRTWSEMVQLHALPRRSIAVCFTPVSGIDSRSQALPGRANSRPEQVQQKYPSSARSRSALGIFMVDVAGCRLRVRGTEKDALLSLAAPKC
jgi:hypothetical protein